MCGYFVCNVCNGSPCFAAVLSDKMCQDYKHYTLHYNPFRPVQCFAAKSAGQH